MFIEVEIGFMVRYTIENNKYEGNRINYSSYVSFNNYNVESSLFYLGTLNVNVTTKITSEIEV